MAEPVIARLSRACPPSAIDDELPLLWRDAGRDGPVARALMANLVVFRDCPAKDAVDLNAAAVGVPIDEVARRHPSRVILLHHGGEREMRGPSEAIITVLLFGEPPWRFGVEEITLRSACAEASLPSIVRRLALGDIPTSIWWTEDLSRAVPVRALVTMGRQLLYDSRQWHDVRAGVLALAPIVSSDDMPDIADLNWRRLTPMRYAITQAFASAGVAVATEGMRLQIRHRPRDGALAWLLAAWFASRLGWAAEWPIAIEETRQGDEVIAVSIGEKGQIVASMNGHRVSVRYGGRTAPFSIGVPRESEADAIAAELRSLTVDSSLRDALVALARRFSASQSS